MTQSCQKSEAVRASLWLGFLPLALLLVAWGVYALGQYHLRQLDMTPFKPCDDIAGQIAADGYLALHLLPYIAVTVLLDLLALLLLFCALGEGILRVLLAAAIGLVWLASAWLHGQAMFVVAIFAG